jgi:hypothetical protein
MRASILPALPLALTLLAGPAAAQEVPPPPTPAQIEAWTGAQVIGTATAKGQSVGPAVRLFHDPQPCGGEGHDATLPVEIRGLDSWLFRIDHRGQQLWVRVTELAPHEVPLPTLYAHGHRRACPAVEGLDLRLAHGGRHIQIEGPCGVDRSSAAALARSLQQQLSPTWLQASSCNDSAPFEAALLKAAGIEASEVQQALAGLDGPAD